MKNIKQIISLIFCSLFFLVPTITSGQEATKITPGTYKTIYEMLRDVPGLDVKISGDGGGTITVRGISSLNNQKPPLFVVDGTIYSGDISNINPQDVESISVLKDAASTSPYGAQGAFGVISITTKKGTTHKSDVVVSNYNKSAYTYFIEHKTPLKVFGFSDEIIVEGVIKEQRDSILVFNQKKKELLVPIKNIKKVEMKPQ